MKGGSLLTVSLLCWSCSCSPATAIRRADLFPFGTGSGDSVLGEGDDETSKVLTLPRPLYFYDSFFHQLYVATNGIISAQDLPMELQYVDDTLPTDFPVVAPFLADIDTSGGRGQIYYRVTETPNVLNRLAMEVNRGFPDANFAPTYAVIATWENVAAHSSQSPSNKVNTFQAVIGYDESDSYILFLYPEDGLNFFGTPPKEPYNVEVELSARVGFSRGEVSYFFISRTDGPFYSVASDTQTVKNLNRAGNTGTPGLWLFHTGNRYSFNNIIPASFGGPLSTSLPEEHIMDTTTSAYIGVYPFLPNAQEDLEYPLMNRGPAESNHPQFLQPGSPEPSHPPAVDPGHHVLLGSERRYEPEPVERQYAPPDLPQLPLEVVDVYPLNRNTPALSPDGLVVSVDEDDVDLDTRVIHYTTENKETCARFQHQCSHNALCSDYPTGYCCHCRSGFYGNGRHCLPDGAPQRITGKVRGTVLIQSTPIPLNDIDLHAYIVVGDGRAYTAISEVPEPLGWALMPVSPIGDLFGWLFALELPNSQAGFKVTGAEFTRHVEVQFYPGNQRLSITQTARGLDPHNVLTVDTVVNGNVPFIPPQAEVTVEPFREIYQYYPSVVTSTSAREFKVASPERGAESYSLNLKQNITYRECRHDHRAGKPETLQINMERVFVMYGKEERILRYAVTNKIGQVGVDPSPPELLNPCYSGNHDCDTTALCVPQEGEDFQCQCATGYRGDGHNCFDIDECAEGSSSCGEHSQCLNLPGSHRCQCEGGYEFGYDRRTCVDIDECASSPCHANARCINDPGTFRCQCEPGFHGDGFTCSQQEDERPRPKTRCEHHRDSVMTTSRDGVPLLGSYIPACSEDGQYLPQQCHGSSGYCWCVDGAGEERPGSRTPPGSPAVDCSRTDVAPRPKTHCEHYRDTARLLDANGRPVAGAYVPQCDESGQYTPRQCHGSSGYCWCVDGSGQERPGTRTTPGSPPVDCSRADVTPRPKTHCEHYRDTAQATDEDKRPGAYAPQCDENGQYTPRQCHSSAGYCWCVDSSGQERPGTRTSFGSAAVDCSRPDDAGPPKTQCEYDRERAQLSAAGSEGYSTAHVPQCDPYGEYTPLQCHGSTGHCWCVDKSGREIGGTRRPPGAQPADCDNPGPERPQTECEQHRERALVTGSDGYPAVGGFIPQCDAEGQYLSQQCHGSTGQCWCVDSRGQERPGTRTSAGGLRVDCDRAEPQRPKTECEHHRDRALASGSDGYPLVGGFVPQCDAEGRYLSQQCHGSTGHCWCVDVRGQERPGTRTSPGSARVDCDRPDPVPPYTRPESVCERWRASLMEQYGGKPEPQQYLPQCQPDGEFSPVQCYGETTYCWCVDQDGREVPGTRSNDVVKPACLSSVAPPTIRPVPRPDVDPPPQTEVTLLYAQGQKIGALPLNGTRLNGNRSKTLLTLHGSIVVGIAFDCRENRVYWTDLSARTINRAAMATGAEPEILISANLVSPEGLAVDVQRRLMFWVDSSPDLIEAANLDGSARRTLFDTDLVNPRAIIVVSSKGTLYWTDWNREAPKIESSSVDGQNRRVVVSDGIGLPNALAYDHSSEQICWADAGTKRLECISPNGSNRRVIHPDVVYPFSMVYHRNHFYYTDWRRDGVIAVSRDRSEFVEEYLPDQRSHLYGIAVATSHCLPGSL